MRGRKQITERPYISNYIFLRFDAEHEGWRHLHAARGIKRVISTSAELPTRVNEKCMQIILDKCTGSYLDEIEVDKALGKFIPLGSIVKMSEGPFQGFTGKVDQVAQQRLEVMLHVFGRPTRVKTTVGEVELVA